MRVQDNIVKAPEISFLRLTIPSFIGILPFSMKGNSSTSPEIHSILEQIASIPGMERGKLSSYYHTRRTTQGKTVRVGPYGKLQTWEEGVQPHPARSETQSRPIGRRSGQLPTIQATDRRT